MNRKAVKLWVHIGTTCIESHDWHLSHILWYVIIVYIQYVIIDVCAICDNWIWRCIDTWFGDYAYMWILVIICEYVLNDDNVHIGIMVLDPFKWLIYWALLYNWVCEIDMLMLFTWLCKVWWIPLIVIYSLFLIILFHNDVNSHPSVGMMFYATSLRYRR